MGRWVRRTVTSLICLGLTVFVVVPVRVAVVEAGITNMDRTVSRALLRLDKRLLANEKRQQLQQARNANRN